MNSQIKEAITYVLNAFALIFSIANVETFLRITSLILAIAFTSAQLYDWIKKRRRK